MEPDSTFYVWGDEHGMVVLSHAACSDELTPKATSVEIPAALAAITAHVCPAV